MSRALLIVDHGSRRAEAHSHLEWVAREVQGRAVDLQVYIAHMELAEPSIAQAIASCVADGATELIVHPLFLVPGHHLCEQIPQLVESARQSVSTAQLPDHPARRERARSRGAGSRHGPGRSCAPPV